MRILQVTDFYPPIVGGIERHVQQLSRALAARGHEVIVATTAERGRPGVEVDHGVEVHRLPTLIGRLPGAHVEAARPFPPPAPDPELTAGLARLIRHRSPDVVHGHSWAIHSYLPLRPVVRTPLVVTLHEYGLVCARKTLVRDDGICSGPGPVKCLGCAAAHYGWSRGGPIAAAELAFGPLLRRAASQIIAVSSAVAIASRLTGRPHEVIPNFLSDEMPVQADRADLQPWLSLLPPRPYLLFVGALGQHKGIDLLFEAYDGLIDPPPLVCIGHRWTDTPRRVPAGVRLFEDWPHDAVRAAWRGCLAGLIPSVWPEPFGIVALEAMEAGRPVIASRIGGLPEVVRDGATGLLVPAGDATALTRAIERLLDDAELRERLGRGAAAEADRYRSAAIVGRIEAIYRTAIAAAGPTRWPASVDAE